MDYGLNQKKFGIGLRNAQKKLQEEGRSVLTNELRRFLPKSSFDQYSDVFPDIIKQVVQITAAGKEQGEQGAGEQQ